MLRTRTYVHVFLVLIALTALTFALSFARLGAFEAPVALAIATVKALLVLFFFMHLVESKEPYWMFLLVGVVLMATLVVLMVTDVTRREPRRVPAGVRPS
jgi:cytochrome c oxidase subunit 4